MVMDVNGSAEGADSGGGPAAPELDVDVVQRRESRATPAQVRALVEEHLRAWAAHGALQLAPGAVLGADELARAPALVPHVQAVALCDAAQAAAGEPVALRMHVHRLAAGEAEREDGPDEEGEAAAWEAWALPHERWHGLWESLVFDSPLKEELLRWATTALALSARGVDERQVSCGRLLLLHGAPGGGKTSLCRALAHKLALRCSERFPRARLLELNAHALHSKWLGESGKRVARLFERVEDAAADPRQLLLVLVDEAESLAGARGASLQREPADALRAVNAALAALDRLRRRANVLLLATSNLTAAIDGAFLDRADLRRAVPLPGAGAAHELLCGGARELMARGVLAPGALFAWRVLQGARFEPSAAARESLRLAAAARRAAAAPLSGRALRRLPALALARRGVGEARWPLPLPAYLDALDAALDDYLREQRALEHAPAATPPAHTSPPDGSALNGH